MLAGVGANDDSSDLVELAGVGKEALERRGGIFVAGLSSVKVKRRKGRYRS